ncbi:MAG TPA: hypothetical protein VD969_06430 [Symbiobacteriaceae bacterium]|nr:hypothetical protein [Symbiobacteriaceae bacterium]
MICHFQGGRRGAAPRPAPQPPPLLPPPDAGPLAPVLAGLVGREIAVLAGGRIYRGRLIQSQPVTLLSTDGQVTVVAAPAKSIEF